MIEENNLIFIYGKPGSYKSSLGANLLNGINKTSCYINLDNNNFLKFNNNVKAYNSEDISDIESIKQCINNYEVTLIDYLELLNYTKNDLLELKKIVEDNNKTLIILTGCSSKDDLMNNNHYKFIKEISNLIIITDK